jgi:hypothetical protein
MSSRALANAASEFSLGLRLVLVVLLLVSDIGTNISVSPKIARRASARVYSPGLQLHPGRGV